MKKLHKRKENPNSGGWLLTYSDMITLVLAFLAILIGSKSMGFDVKPFIQAFNGNISILNNGYGQDNLLNIPSIVSVPKVEERDSDGKKRNSLQIELKKILIAKNIKYEKSERGVRIFLFDNFFFDFNRDKLFFDTPKSKKVLSNSRTFFDALFYEIGLEKKNKIIFEGYAESQENNPFLLAFSRANNLINDILSIDSPYPLNKTLFSIQSYGDTLSDQEQNSDGRAYQRKVSIVITFDQE